MIQHRSYTLFGQLLALVKTGYLTTSLPWGPLGGMVESLQAHELRLSQFSDTFPTEIEVYEGWGE